MGGHEHRRVLLIAWLALCAACGGSEVQSEPSERSAAPAAPRQPASTKPAAVAAPDPSLPVSKRMQGRWLVNLQQVPRAVLKEQGIPPKSRIEYLITDNEFILDAAGRRVRWHYEIVSESGNEIVLRKTDGVNAPEEATVRVIGNRLLINKEGETPLPLDRI